MSASRRQAGFMLLELLIALVLVALGLALAAQLKRWTADPRVQAILQYTFRDDPAFPVGLLSADLAHVRADYRLWLLYTQARAQGKAPPQPAQLCA